MAASRRRTGQPLTLQVGLVLAFGAALLSAGVAHVSAERDRLGLLEDRRARLDATGASLAARAAQLLERGDDLRLSVLAASAADLSGARVLVLDSEGVVRIDTGLALGGERLGIESADGPVRRTLEDGYEEVAVGALGSDGFAGEVRLRARPVVTAGEASWPTGLFGLVLLGNLSLVAVACWMVHAWVARLRRVTVGVQRLARGEDGHVGAGLDGAERVVEGAVGGLQEAVLEFSARVDEGTERARDAFLRLGREVVQTLERRGLVPAGRPERVRDLAGVLAEAAGGNSEQIQEVREAGLLLDLGKVGVRPSALTKTGPLDDVERESLRQHPLRGGRLLSGFDPLRGVAAAVRHQHEKWDGTGFPQGLRAERIPFAARVLSIASAFDQLVTGTPGFPGITWPAALDRLRDDRGEHFDPRLLDLFEEQIRAEPPHAATQGKRVLISTAGVVPHRVPYEDGLGFGFAEDYPEATEEILAIGQCELELLPDDLGGLG